MADQTTNPRPLGPTYREGMDPRAYRAKTMVDNRSAQPDKGDLVGKQHSRNPMGDPSVGTARFRAQGLEKMGARHRIHPPMSAPNSPLAAATQANGRIITSRPAIMQDKRYGPGVESEFDDAAVVAGRAAGETRLYGYAAPTRPQGG